MIGRVWDAILVTVDGFGGLTALAASRVNRAAKISAVTQIGRLWDAILVTDEGIFMSPPVGVSECFRQQSCQPMSFSIN